MLPRLMPQLQLWEIELTLFRGFYEGVHFTDGEKYTDSLQLFLFKSEATHQLTTLPIIIYIKTILQKSNPLSINNDIEYLLLFQRPR